MRTFKPSIPVTEFPTRDTHPLAEDQLLVQELEDDPDFWSKMNDDDKHDSPSKNGGEDLERQKKQSECSLTISLCPS